MTSAAWRVAPLLFLSGLCALVYQIAWLREFRLIFGASTAASAAVVAIFIGGLGLGGLLLGRLADRHPRPLWLYARLEALVALSTAATPGLLWLVRRAYVGLGGTLTLSVWGGTVARLVLAGLVLAVPTLLMGGTLPAAARSVASAKDEGRLSLALLYGVNTLGAVAGCFVATFLMLEVFGTRSTLWLACLVNLVVAVLARQVARMQPPEGALSEREENPLPPPAPVGFVLTAAAVVGFAFFLMELVWYRMLGPILGGSVYTFGLILAVALLGIGLGGTAYSLLGRTGPASLVGFAYTCVLEALCLALPYALGDRIAVLALLLRPLGAAALFWGQVLAWTVVCFLVVLPAAFVAGVQFPMLVALLGRGKKDVARQIGLTYAWNTMGAIAGSLAGGFGLIPLLSAPGAWRATAAALGAFGLAAVVLAARREGARRRLLIPVTLALLVGVMLQGTGPTAAWRHSGVGVGHSLQGFDSPNELRRWLNYHRRIVQWEADGIESSVALEAGTPGLAFVVNGKVDGNARGDAPTMVMSGMVGALLHPHPRRSMVIGLGTGETAGWLAVVPSMERTDVVELEPQVLDVARACSLANQNLMANPRVHITVGDARETLLVSREEYDLVFSEPSNPYRAGIASLFTKEYYDAISRRMGEEGIFLQWVQAYDVDARTIRTIYATVSSVFPHVETWQVGAADLLLVASKKALTYDATALRQRLQQEPYRSAVRFTWRVTDLEGWLSFFVATSSFARSAAASAQDLINTDDLNHVEFGFARTVGRAGLFNINELRDLARARGEDRPEVGGGGVDWQRVEDARLAFYPRPGQAPFIQGRLTAEQRRLATAFAHHQMGDMTAALASWRATGREPRSPDELALVASGLAEAGDDGALSYIEGVRALQPVEADGILARLLARQGHWEEATRALEAALGRFHEEPWASSVLTLASLRLATELGNQDPALALRLFQRVREPFALYADEDDRLPAMAALLSRLNLTSSCAEALRPLEPHVLWNLNWLVLRRDCYAATRDPLAQKAASDLAEYLRYEPVIFTIDPVQRSGAGASPLPAEPRESPVGSGGREAGVRR
jgi:spermidine synthase/MFS family permease